MLVVSDNSPINILIRINKVDVLPALFGIVVIPVQVADEMMHPAAPQAVRQFIMSRPPWLRLAAPRRLLELPRLDLGERAAIGLALELRADVLLVDESDGRKSAMERGINVVGAIGVLERAADMNLIDDLNTVHDAVRPCGFHVAETLLSESIARHLAGRTGR